MQLLTISECSRRFVWKEIRSKRGIWIVMLALSILAGSLEISGVGLVYPLMLVIVDPAMVVTFPKIGWLTSHLGLSGHYQIFGFLFVLVFVLVVLKNVGMGWFRYWQCQTLAKWKTELSERLLRIYLFSDFKIHMEKTTSEIIRNVILTHQVHELFFKSLINMIVSISICIGLSAMLMVVLPVSTTFGSAVLLITAMVVYFAKRQFLVKLGEASNELSRKRTQLITQSLGAIKEAKVLGKEGVFVERIVSVEDGYFAKESQSNFLQQLPFLVSETVVIACLLSIVFFEIVVQHQKMALADLGLLAATLFRLGPQINKVLIYLQLMNVSQTALDIISEEVECYEPGLVIPAVQKERFANWKTLEFRNVSYAYPNSNGRNAIESLSFTLHRNEFLGITGASGSGKSTLMMLLMGLIKPSEGEILLDGLPLYSPDDIRRWQNGIGYVPQTAFLMEASLKENILYVAENEEVDEDRLQHLVDLVHLNDYLAEQPDGLDASVGENGTKLSGGQRQRVVIARSLYHDPDLLAFDEATASLDVNTERAVSDNLLGYQGQKTITAIAHRLVTLKSCDRILLMESGRILALGPFAELCETSPHFQRLVDLSGLREEKKPMELQTAA